MSILMEDGDRFRQQGRRPRQGQAVARTLDLLGRLARNSVASSGRTAT
jgi:hypothetical protein